MTGRNSVQSRRIAAQLMMLRRAAGMSGDNAATRLGWSPSKVSRVERALSPIGLEDLGSMLGLYRVPAAERDAMMGLARRLSGRLLDDYADSAVIQEWAVTAFPLAARSAAYARAVLEAGQPLHRRSPSELEREACAAGLRAEKLTGGTGQQLQLCFDEAVTLRQYGSPAVMAGQLAWLRKLAGLPGVQIRMLPLSAVTLRPPAFSLFSLTEDASPAFPPAVLVEHLREPWLSVTEDVSFRHRLAFEYIWAQALDPEATAVALAEAEAVRVELTRVLPQPGFKAGAIGH